MRPSQPYADPKSHAPAGGLDDASASDEALFDAALSGNYAAFESVVKRHHQRLFRVALGMMQNVTDAEEVVQEAFFQVFRGLAKFRGASRPSTWMYQITVNTALMRLRQRRRKPLLSVGEYPHLEEVAYEPLLGPQGQWARSPDASLLDQELAGNIETAIGALPDKYRRVMQLRDVEGHSAEEAAESLGLSVPTIKARLHRARLSVRLALHRYLAAAHR